MKVLVTGGAGYIGSVLVKELLAWREYLSPEYGVSTPVAIGNCNKHVVSKLTVIDNLVRKQNTLGEFVMDPRFEFIKANIVDTFKYKGDIKHLNGSEIKVDELAMEYDIVIPLAGIVGAPRSQEDFTLCWLYNYTWAENFIESLREHAKKPIKIIFPCTNSGYGSRSDGGYVTEEDPLNPISAYGRSKVVAERLILDYGGVSLRLATVMGWSPCMRLDLLVNDFVWQAVKQRHIVLFEKHFKRNYVHVQDVAQAFILAIKNYDQMKGQAYNVGLSEANLSKLELSNKIAEHTEFHIVEAPLMEDPDKRDYLVSNEKIEAMGFTPMWNMDNTIKQLLKFYKTITLDSANVFFDNWHV